MGTLHFNYHSALAIDMQHYKTEFSRGCIVHIFQRLFQGSALNFPLVNILPFPLESCPYNRVVEVGFGSAL